MSEENGYALNLQWFPGHMTKAQRMIEKDMKLVDAVCEVVDARIPVSSRNPDIERLSAGKPRLIVFNRADQADPAVTALWREHFKKSGVRILETDAKSGKGVQGFAPAVRELLREKREQYAAKGQGSRPLRLMVLGIPNVGKSTLINKVAGKKAAAASDRPGVTRGKQWISIGAGLELLDTPGILWPRFDSQTVGENLAFTGAIRDEIVDRETLAANLLLRLRACYPDRIEMRYKFAPAPEATGVELLETAAGKRGFLISGGECDLERMSAVLLDEFRGGLLGRITLEKPEAAE